MIGRIREALSADPRVSDQNIEVAVVAEKVFLTGEVPTEERWRAITEVVVALLPDLEVVNQIAISGFPEPVDEERLG